MSNYDKLNEQNDSKSHMNNRSDSSQNEARPRTRSSYARNNSWPTISGMGGAQKSVEMFKVDEADHAQVNEPKAEAVQERMISRPQPGQSKAKQQSSQPRQGQLKSKDLKNPEVGERAKKDVKRANVRRTSKQDDLPVLEDDFTNSRKEREARSKRRNHTDSNVANRQVATKVDRGSAQERLRQRTQSSQSVQSKRNRSSAQEEAYIQSRNRGNNRQMDESREDEDMNTNPVLIGGVVVAGIVIVILFVILLISIFNNGKNPAVNETEPSLTPTPVASSEVLDTPTPTPEETKESTPAYNLAEIQMPDYVREELIDPNEFSRPQIPLTVVNNIVVHYVGNPNTSAQANVNYFKSLGEQTPGDENAHKASSQFVIGLEGEIIQCVPIYEVAYCSNNRNNDTISIECCHPDEGGQFTEATYNSLIKLLTFLCRELGLSEQDIIRHYDVTGKLCPIYYVNNSDAWEQLKLDLGASLKNSLN